MNIPLKTANGHFILYKTIALPTRISDDKFVKYVFDYPYFGLDKNQHDYILLSEADLLRCKTSSITICSADVAIYHASTPTCQASLYLLRTDSHNLCQRSLLLHHKTPTLQRHETIWLYQFPEPQQAVIHCPGIDDKTPCTEILSGTGIIRNATRCSISISQIRTLADLQGTSRTEMHPSHFYIHDKLSIVAEHEVKLIEEAMPATVEQLNKIKTKLRHS